MPQTKLNNMKDLIEKIVSKDTSPLIGSRNNSADVPYISLSAASRSEIDETISINQ